MITAVALSRPLGVGVLVTALVFGIRHGIDWDHLAAISDISASQSRPRRAMALAGLYAVGHATVVVALGALAVVGVARLPSWIDGVLQRFVGATLLVLGVYVAVTLARDRGQARLRSRWSLLAAVVRRCRSRARGTSHGVVVVEHDHPHDHPHGHPHGHPDGHPQAHAEVDVHVCAGARDTLPSPASPLATRTEHRHVHRHVAVMPDDPIVAGYGAAGAFGVGVLHGIGAETPTQVVILVSAAGASGVRAGLAILIAFVIGLLVSNTAVAAVTTFGIVRPARGSVLFPVLAGVTAVCSLVIGTMFVLGLGSALPSILGG